MPKRRSFRRRKNGPRGRKAEKKKTIAEMNISAESTSVPKRRKRVVKSLPKPRSQTEKARKNISRKRTKGSNLELHKYYRTELLGGDEEYSLGMKIQFMVKCEQVHEGLATSLMRLPTIPEWAEACG